MTEHERRVADAMAQGMTRREAEHDATLPDGDTGPEYCGTCDEREPVHPVNPACDRCHGRGHVIGGDAYRPCPSCRLATVRVSPFVRAAMAGVLPVKVVA